MRCYTPCYLLLTTGLLSACGGGSTTANPGPSVIEFSSSEISSGTSFDDFLVEAGSRNALDHRPVEGFDSIGYDGSGLLFFGRVGDEVGFAQVYAIIDERTNTLFPGHGYARSDGTLPEGGSARYRGDYVGLITREPRGTIEYLAESYIEGDVRLDVDLDAMTIEGDITDRMRFITATGNPAPFGMRDVTLFSAPVNEIGEFFGTTGGGRFDNPIFVPASGGDLIGQYQGAVAGDVVERDFLDDATAHSVGIVRINHNYNFTTELQDDYVELGAFVADLSNEG